MTQQKSNGNSPQRRPTSNGKVSPLQRATTSSLDSMQAYLQEKFDSLTLDVQRNQDDTVKLLNQLQEQLQSLESQMQQRLESSGRSRSPVEQDAPARTHSALKKTNTTGPSELVPLLEAEDGAQAASSSLEKVASDSFMNRSSTNNLLRTSIIPTTGMTRQEKLRTAQEAMQAGKIKQSWSVKVVTAFLEDADSSYAAWCYSQFMLIFLVFAISMALLPYVDVEVPETVALLIDSLLCLEIFVRGVFCPNLKAFFVNHANIIDGMSITPIVVMSLMECGVIRTDWGGDFLIFAVPVIRFLRLVRRFPKMQILISAFKDCLEALPVLMYTLVVMGCIFTSSIFLVEPRDNIVTLSESAWFVLTTISTVGYGDITPETKTGSALASVLMVVSQLYMAMPFGIIGYNFTEIWGNRAQILLLNGTRERFAKWGFGAYEMPYLFQLFDLDDNEEIDLPEFLALIQQMEIGIRQEDAIELFRTIDKDSGGTIDEREFVKTLYPKEYRFMYGKMKREDMMTSEGTGG